MGLEVDHHVRYARTPTGGASLPAVDLPEHHQALPDRIGEQVRERLALVGSAAALGAGTLGTLARRGGAGIPRTIGAGVAGALIGAATAVSAGLLVDLRRPAPTASSEPVVPPTVAHPGEQLRVMTFNLHGGTGEPGSTHGGAAEVERLARAIEREQPDVVLLQEVNEFALENSYGDALAQLADRLGATGAVAVPSIRNATGRTFGTGVLTFHGTTVQDARGLLATDPAGDGVGRRAAGMVDTAVEFVAGRFGHDDVRPFGTRPYRARATTDVLVRTPAGNAVRVLSGHFGWPEGGVDVPRRQVDPTAALLGAWDGPTILGADFNVVSGTRDGDREASAFAAAGMTDAFTSRGIGVTDPRRASFASSGIDRIYASDQVAVRDVRVAPDLPGELPASDHRPVVADVTIGRAGD